MNGSWPATIAYVILLVIGLLGVAFLGCIAIRREAKDDIEALIPEENNEPTKVVKQCSGYTITFIPWEDNEGKEVVLGRCKTEEEKNDFIEKLHKIDSGLTDEELSTVSVYNSYYYRIRG